MKNIVLVASLTLAFVSVGLSIVTDPVEVELVLALIAAALGLLAVAQLPLP